MRPLKRIDNRHSPNQQEIRTRKLVSDAIRIVESDGDEADRLEFGPLGSELATTIFIKHADDDVTSRDIRGKRGRRGRAGLQGVHGLVGRDGKTGEQGVQGPHGEQGVVGRQGVGLPGERGLHGDKGDKGDKGDTGPVPAHKWDGTKLSWELPGGGFSFPVNLKGDTGGRGMSSRGSGNMAHVQQQFDRARSLAFFLGT